VEARPHGRRPDRDARYRGGQDVREAPRRGRGRGRPRPGAPGPLRSGPPLPPPVRGDGHELCSSRPSPRWATAPRGPPAAGAAPGRSSPCPDDGPTCPSPCCATEPSARTPPGPGPAHPLPHRCGPGAVPGTVRGPAGRHRALRGTLRHLSLPSGGGAEGPCTLSGPLPPLGSRSGTERRERSGQGARSLSPTPGRQAQMPKGAAQRTVPAGRTAHGARHSAGTAPMWQRVSRTGARRGSGRGFRRTARRRARRPVVGAGR